MKLIKELEELIEEEIHDVKKYAKLAAEVKDEYPMLAQVFYTLSTQEDSHQAVVNHLPECDFVPRMREEVKLPDR